MSIILMALKRCRNELRAQRLMNKVLSIGLLLSPFIALYLFISSAQKDIAKTTVIEAPEKQAPKSSEPSNMDACIAGKYVVHRRLCLYNKRDEDYIQKSWNDRLAKTKEYCEKMITETN